MFTLLLREPDSEMLAVNQVRRTVVLFVEDIQPFRSDVQSSQDELRQVTRVDGNVELQHLDAWDPVGFDHTADEVEPLALWLGEVTVRRRRRGEAHRQAGVRLPHRPFGGQVLRVEARERLGQLLEGAERLALPELPDKDAVMAIDRPMAQGLPPGQQDGDNPEIE